MSRHPARPLIPALLALIALLILTPSLATAQPSRASSTPANTPASTTLAASTFPLLAHLRSLFSVFLKNGSILDPDGRPGPATTTGDNGSGLDPDGRH